MASVKTGDVIPFDSVISVKDETVKLKGSSGLVHLQLRGVSGCPVCNTHLRSVPRRLDTLAAAHIQEVVVSTLTRTSSSKTRSKQTGLRALFS
jgi:peroxiredoxin